MAKGNDEAHNPRRKVARDRFDRMVSLDEHILGRERTIDPNTAMKERFPNDGLEDWEYETDGDYDDYMAQKTMAEEDYAEWKERRREAADVKNTDRSAYRGGY